MALKELSSLLGNLTLFSLIFLFVLVGWLRAGAGVRNLRRGSQGRLRRGQNLLPYLVAMLCAIGVLRLRRPDIGLDGIRSLIEWAGWDTCFVDALPTALVKPFSGSAARAMLIETMQTHGVDSFPALVAATIQGSTETTFCKCWPCTSARSASSVPARGGLCAGGRLAGVLAAIGVCYWFFG